MPCAALARGIRQTPPHTGLPFVDLINNSPCGRRVTVTANSVDFTAHSLCLFHLRQKLGDRDVQAPYVDAA